MRRSIHQTSDFLQTSDFSKKSDVSRARAAYCIPDAHGRCVTCSDEVQRATVLAVDEALLMAQADIEGDCFDIDVSLVAGVQEGDVLLVHGGVALEKA